MHNNLTNLLIEIDVAVIEQVHKVLDGRHGWVLPACQALICFALLSATNEALNLDNLLHVLFVELLLFGVFLADY